MAGICLCRFKDCINKDTCLRFQTKENEMSSFAEFQHICTKENNYEHFWKMEVVANESKTEQTGD
jgi:hypothetical protein